MANLPSYEDAIARPDWLTFVAPYISLRDYTKLCRVSKRFYRHFAPRLWQDPVRTALASGLDPHDGLPWFFRFVERHVVSVRSETAALVTCVDLSGLPAGSGSFYYAQEGIRQWDVLQDFDSIFPNLRCVLLDGHPECNPGYLTKVIAGKAWKQLSLAAPLMLSVAACQYPLSTTFFQSPLLKNLVYLDISDMPGSLKTTLSQSSFGPTNLPSLRILKAVGREVDDNIAAGLCGSFKEQLWSLDLSRNLLSDAFIATLGAWSFGDQDLRSDTYFDAEGKISQPPSAGTEAFGPFYFVDESPWSSTFDHPRRYLVDAPVYIPDTGVAPQEDSVFRLDGRGKILQDRSQSVKEALSGEIFPFSSDSSDLVSLAICRGHGSISHLHLDMNKFSSRAIQDLIFRSRGHLEHLDWGSTRIDHLKFEPPEWMAKTAELRGVVGIAHLFRPVLSSNLRSLRIHHSLVTQTPTVEDTNSSGLMRLWLAEALFQPRIALAYPQSFVPDMNPRLYSLTLTNIPRRSKGHVLQKLTELLKLAAQQERDIQRTRGSGSRRSPRVLLGLRHIRLEIDPDPTGDTTNLYDAEGLDTEALMQVADEEFSFFGEAGWTSSPTLSNPSSPTQGQAHANDSLRIRSDPEEETGSTTQSARFKHAPFTETDADRIPYTGSWNGTAFTVPVWIGPGVIGPHEAVNAYMQLLKDPALRSDVVPASPCHVLAGVPAGSYIYRAAWDAMLRLPAMRRPTMADLKDMKDVAAEIRNYRLKTKAAHEARQNAATQVMGRSSLAAEESLHWTGRLELVHSVHHAHSSDYWRNGAV